MKLSNDVVRFRAKNRLSQKKLAEMCGVTTQTISNIESGVRMPSRVTETKIRLVIGGGEDD